jgi:glycosyltransferase involved in cell wall biosynthesis
MEHSAKQMSALLNKMGCLELAIIGVKKVTPVMISPITTNRNQRKKLVISTNFVTPYRVALFAHLVQIPEIDLTVFFSIDSAKNRKWKTDLGERFNYNILPNWKLRFPGWEGYSLIFQPTLLYELRSIKPDAIVVLPWADLSSMLAFLLCKWWRIPFILWNGSTINEHSLGRTLTKPLLKFIVKYSDAYVAYGTRAKEYLVVLGAKEEAIFFVNNTVNVSFFSEQSSLLSSLDLQQIKRTYGIETEKVVLYVGQLIERKGIRYLLDAFAKLKQEDNRVGLAIVGHGPQEEDLRSLCLQKDIQDVYFCGHIDPAHLPEIYSAADLFILPSMKEVWGLVLNEAMACGLPVISTNTAGASVDLIQEGVNGYIVDAGDTFQLYEAMKKITTEPGRMREMGAKSKEIILSGFTLDHAVQGFVQALEYVSTKDQCLAYVPDNSNDLKE